MHWTQPKPFIVSASVSVSVCPVSYLSVTSISSLYLLFYLFSLSPKSLSISFYLLTLSVSVSSMYLYLFYLSLSQQLEANVAANQKFYGPVPKTLQNK
jgi:hypothetical protein